MASARHSRRSFWLALAGYALLGVVAPSCGKDAATSPEPVRRRAASVRVVPEAVVVDQDQTVGNLRLKVLDAAGREVDDPLVRWVVSDSNVATVSATGTLSGRYPGTTTVTATVDGVTGSAAIAVRSAGWGRMLLDPGFLVLLPGQSVRLEGTAANRNGDTNPIPAPLALTSSDEKIVAIHEDGTVTAVSPGIAWVAARYRDLVGAVPVTVSDAVVGSMALSLVRDTIRVFEATVAAATVNDAGGQPIPSLTPTFASSDTAVARVASNGTVTGVGVGVATITATAGRRSVSAPLRVTHAAVAAIDPAPGRATLLAGQTVTVSALALDKLGRPIAGAPMSFASSNPAVASIDAAGLVTARSPGVAFIVARSETASVAISVAVLPATDKTWLRFDSERDEWLGEGNTYSYTDATSAIYITLQGAQLEVDVIDAERKSWLGYITLPTTLGRIQPGTWVAGVGYPGYDPTIARMDWSFGNGGCNLVRGSLTIDTARYVSDALAALDLSFVQHCDGDPPALRGTVHWRPDLDAPPPPPGPIVPIPTGLWTPPAGAAHPSGNWVYLESDDGDWIGQGGTYRYQSPTASIDAATERRAMGDGSITVNVSQGTDVWSAHFRAPDGFVVVPPGYYPDVNLYWFLDRRRGGLRFHGFGRTCVKITGWFAIDSARYEGDTLTALDARFEQHCERIPAALRGAIHWRGASSSGVSARRP